VRKREQKEAIDRAKLEEENERRLDKLESSSFSSVRLNFTAIL
jgi:hypothetical protein